MSSSDPKLGNDHSRIPSQALSAIRRQECAGGKPQPINSWPTAGARAALPPFLPEAPSPLPFPFEDPPQSLTARRAAKPLASAVTGAYEPLFTPRALAAKKIAITRWGMTLAGRRRRRVGETPAAAGTAA